MNLLEGCNEEIGGLCCIAFKPIIKDGAVTLKVQEKRAILVAAGN